MARFHADVVQTVAQAISNHQVVVVGMAQNPYVRRARKALQAAGVAHEYLEFGSYLAKWRERLAIKLWSGWPTFPQVFVGGTLVGGFAETQRALEDGTLVGTAPGPSPEATAS